MVEFHVDLQALQELSLRLAVIHDSLLTAPSDFGAAGGQLGSDSVASALSGFCSGWKDGREKIQSETAALVTAVAGVAEAYLKGETVITGSLLPTRPVVHRHLSPTGGPRTRK